MEKLSKPLALVILFITTSIIWFYQPFGGFRVALLYFPLGLSAITIVGYSREEGYSKAIKKEIDEFGLTYTIVYCSIFAIWLYLHILPIAAYIFAISFLAVFIFNYFKRNRYFFTKESFKNLWNWRPIRLSLIVAPLLTLTNLVTVTSEGYDFTTKEQILYLIFVFTASLLLVPIGIRFLKREQPPEPELFKTIFTPVSLVAAITFILFFVSYVFQM
jgi:hypothetical protein